MRRFFTDKINKPEMLIDGNEYKHVSEVLRAKVGENIIMCNGDGTDYVFQIKNIGKKDILLSYVSENKNETETNLDLTVFFALLKGDKSEFVVTKLTELGIKHIVPFISEYTVKTGEKTDRLERAAIEACKQCGRAVLPKIGKVIKFEEISKLSVNYDKMLFAYENAYVSGERIKNIISGKEQSIALVIGAEGGFSESESKLMLDNNIPAVTLGKRILRAETASIAASAVILSLCGEWE